MKKEFIYTTTKPSGPEITQIYFGEKPTTETLWDGCWNPTYRYKNKLDKLFYYPCLQIIESEKNKISDIDIIFLPNDTKHLKNKKLLMTRRYNWANPYFWIDSGLYPESNMRIEDQYHYLNRNNKTGALISPPIDEDFEIMFDDIWKICVLKEGKASISQLDFTNYIRLIRFLIENAIFFPLEALDFDWWQRYGRQYLDEAEGISIFDHNTQELLKGWFVTEKDDSDKIRTIFLSDIKKIFNLFIEKVNPNSGLGLFLYKIYCSFATELIEKKLFIKCLYCGRLAEYLKGKKYCSLKSDGRNCGKSARNKRYYRTKGKQRLLKYRQTTQELRTLYKEKGIKK